MDTAGKQDIAASVGPKQKQYQDQQNYWQKQYMW